MCSGCSFYAVKVKVYVCRWNINLRIPKDSQHKYKYSLMFFPLSSLSLSSHLPLSSDSPGLKSIMKKDGVADKQGNKRAKKNLKFVGVNGG